MGHLLLWTFAIFSDQTLSCVCHWMTVTQRPAWFVTLKVDLGEMWVRKVNHFSFNIL